MLAGIISSPTAYSPRQLPRERDGAPQPGAREHARAGLHHRGGVHRVHPDRRPDRRRRSPPPAENSPPRTSPPGCASSWSTATAPARRSAAGCRSSRRSTSTSRTASRTIIQSTLAGIPPTASAVVIDNKTGGVRAMVGGPDYDESPFNLATNGHRQPGLVVQAVHAGHRARAGPLDRRGLRLGAAADPVPGQGAEEERQGRQVVNDLFRVNNYDDNYLGSRLDRYRDHLLRQLGLLPARHPGRGPERRRNREEDGDRDRPRLDAGLRLLDPGRPLAAVQPGADPRRSGDRRHPARDGPRLQDAGGRRQPALRARWRPAPAGRSGSSRSRTAATATMLPAAATLAGPDRRQRRQQAGHQAGDRPDRRRRPPRMCSSPWSAPAPAAGPRTATRPGARPGRPTTTATPGSAAQRPTSPPASGSATATR